MTLQCRATNLFSHCVFTLSAHHSSLLRVWLYSLCRPRIDFLILGRWSHFKVEVVPKQTWTPQNLTHVHTGKYYHKQWRELNVKKKYCTYTSELETDINCCAFRYAVPTEIDSSFLSTLVDSYCWWVEAKSLLQHLCTQRKQTFSVGTTWNWFKLCLDLVTNPQPVMNELQHSLRPQIYFYFL